MRISEQAGIESKICLQILLVRGVQVNIGEIYMKGMDGRAGSTLWRDQQAILIRFNTSFLQAKLSG